MTNLTREKLLQQTLERYAKRMENLLYELNSQVIAPEPEHMNAKPLTRKENMEHNQKIVEQFEKEWREESEQVTWMQECADFWEHYSYITERAQEKYNVEAEMWIEKLRAASPKKEWVGLTDETYWEMWVESPSDVLRFAHAIEAKLKEKNT